MAGDYYPRRKTVNKNYIPAAALMEMARGQWLEILTTAGIPTDSLVGSRGRPCPRCGGRDRFSPLRDFTDRGAVLCRHCHNGRTVPRCGDGVAALRWWLGVEFAETLRWLSGWLGVIPGYHCWHVLPVVPSVPSTEPLPQGDRFQEMAVLMQRNLRPNWLLKAAAMLGLPADALRRLRVGWSAEHRATSWPMRDSSGNVIGIRLRCPTTARKWAIKGSRSGLIYDLDLLSTERPERILVCEGPTDTAALLSLGMAAVGVPSAGGGRDLLTALVSRLRPADVVIVADGDGPGLAGAQRVAESLSTASVRIVYPPAGIKDARAWVLSGADSESMRDACDVSHMRWPRRGSDCHE